MLCLVSKYIKEGWPKDKTLALSRQLFSKVSDELCLENGLIMRLDKLVPPKRLRMLILKSAHEGHLRATFTNYRVHSDSRRLDREVDLLVEDGVVGSTSDQNADNI